MMSCSSCRERLYIEYDVKYHKCKPLFLVWRPDYGETSDDAHEVRALNYAYAAEQWAEESDREGDYTIVGGAEAELYVRAYGEETFKIFIVTGEGVPQYYAHEKEDKT